MRPWATRVTGALQPRISDLANAAASPSALNNSPGKQLPRHLERRDRNAITAFSMASKQAKEEDGGLDLHRAQTALGGNWEVPKGPKRQAFPRGAHQGGYPLVVLISH